MRKIFGRIFAAAAMWAFLYITELSGSLPSEILMFSGSPHSISTADGVRLGKLPEAVTVAADTVTVYETGDYEAELTAFGGMARRKVNIKVVEPRSVFLGGSLVGIKLRGAGVIVIGFADFYTGNILKKGDIILSANGMEIKSCDDLVSLADGRELSLLVSRNEREFETVLTPVLCADGAYRLGLWARDSAAGVGTLTYVDIENGVYGALGHGINESDTGVRFPVRKGTVERSLPAGVVKGKRGEPGEITGAFVGSETLGTIELNSECGIFGRLLGAYDEGETLPIGLAWEVETGPAQIVCDVGEGRRYYDVNIMRVNRLGSPIKGILLEVTDKRLLELTGGIVRGMSGAGLVQNGKLIGAVTHVLVNDSSCGYGVFIENMLDCSDSIAASGKQRI